MTACEQHIMITFFVSKDLTYVMDSAMEIMLVGCFYCTGCIIAMLPNNVQDYKIVPQVMPIGSFTVPKVAANAEANAEEDDDIVPMDEESAALD